MITKNLEMLARWLVDTNLYQFQANSGGGMTINMLVDILKESDGDDISETIEATLASENFLKEESIQKLTKPLHAAKGTVGFFYFGRSVAAMIGFLEGVIKFQTIDKMIPMSGGTRTAAEITHFYLNASNKRLPEINVSDDEDTHDQPTIPLKHMQDVIRLLPIYERHNFFKEIFPDEPIKSIAEAEIHDAYYSFLRINSADSPLTQAEIRDLNLWFITKGFAKQTVLSGTYTEYIERLVILSKECRGVREINILSHILNTLCKDIAAIYCVLFGPESANGVQNILLQFNEAKKEALSDIDDDERNNIKFNIKFAAGSIEKITKTIADISQETVKSQEFAQFKNKDDIVTITVRKISGIKTNEIREILERSAGADLYIKDTFGGGLSEMAIAAKYVTINASILDSLMNKIGRMILWRNHILRFYDELGDFIQKISTARSESEKETMQLMSYAISAQTLVAESSDRLEQSFKALDPEAKSIAALMKSGKAKLEDIPKTTAPLKSIKDKDLLIHYSDISKKLDAAFNELQEEVKRLRMVPISAVLNAAKRSAQHVLRDFPNKDANISVRSSNELVDKDSLSTLEASMMLIASNMAYHGIENESDRAEKTEKALIEISSKHEEDRLIIKIKDNGAGINGDVVADAAIKKGKISAQQVSKMSNEDKIDLIFMDSVSTEEDANTKAGRGEGLAQVKEQIESIGGTINVESEVGVGTEFIISIPTEASIAKILLADVNGATLGIPLSDMKKVVSVKGGDIKRFREKSTLYLDDEMIDIANPGSIYDIVPQTSVEDFNKFVIITDKTKNIAFPVSYLKQKEEVIIKPINIRMDGSLGVTITGSGEIVSIIDVRHIIRVTTA